MMYTLAFLFGILISALTVSIFLKKKNAFESLIFGFVLFFCTYIIGSIALFEVNQFTLRRSMALTDLLSLLLIVIVVVIECRKKTGQKFSVTIKELLPLDFSLKPVCIPLLVCLAAFPFVHLQNGFFGMGQDQGVYQTVAINYMSGKTLRQQDFIEYQTLPTEQLKKGFYEQVKSELGGYDIPNSDYPETVYDRNVSKVSGIYHGIATFPAILALWGEVFGMSDMMGIQILFYFCTIFLTFFVCRNLKLKTLSCAAASVIVAAAPIVIWVAKSALTELFTAILLLLFLYFLTDNKNEKHKWLSIVPIAIFGCYHVSIYTLVPIFLLIYAGLYLVKREKQYAILMLATPLVYFASYLLMKHIQPMYTMNNYRDIFVAGINVHNLSKVIVCVVIASLLICGLYVLILKKKKAAFNEASFIESFEQSKLARISLQLLFIIPLLIIVLRSIMKFDTIREANSTALWGNIGNAGFLLIPIALICALVRPKFFLKNSNRLIIFMAFFYCVLIYSALLRFEIQYYYYYARYLAPFVPIAAVFGVMTLDHFNWKIFVPVVGCGIAMIIPYDMYLMNNQDDTLIDWTVIEELSNEITEDDCLVIDAHYQSSLWLPMKNITDADVYPLTENPEELLSFLAYNYKNVYWLTSEGLDSAMGELQYYKHFRHIEDDLHYVGSIIPMSKKFYEYSEPVKLYRFYGYQYVYTSEEDAERCFENVGVLEDTFRWTSSPDSYFHCNLRPDDYSLTINLGCAIPLNIQPDQTVKATVSINNHLLTEYQIDSSNNGQPIVVSIPEQFVEDGENIITLNVPLWSVADVNPNDTRMLGIAIESLQFDSAQ